MDIPLRKRLAGSDSFGNVWPADGAVLAVPYEQAIALLSIVDGGFSEASPDEVEPGPIDEVAADGDITEPAPDTPPDDAPPAKRPYRRRTAEA